MDSDPIRMVNEAVLMAGHPEWISLPVDLVDAYEAALAANMRWIPIDSRHLGGIMCGPTHVRPLHIHPSLVMSPGL